MKLKYFQASKLLLIVFLFFGYLNSYAVDLKQQTTKIEEIKNIKEFKEKYIFYTRSSIYGNNYVEDIEDWIAYFEEVVETHKSDENAIFLEFILVHLYRISNNIDKAINLGLESYYNNSKEKKYNVLLCRLLQEIENCYYLKNNSLELIRLNKEKFKICGKNDVIFHQIYFNMGLYDLALKNYKENINYNTLEYKKYDLYAQAFHNNDFGVYYMYDNKIDSALYYYKKSIKLFNKQKEKQPEYRKNQVAFMLGTVNGNIATCLLKQNKFKEAIPLYLDEIRTSIIFYNDPNWFGSDKVYNRITLCYINIGEFEKANIYINKLKKNKSLYFKSKSEYHSKLKNKDSTLFYNNKYIIVSDSIFKEEMKQQKIESLGVLEFNDQLKNKQKQINVLEEKDNNKSAQIKLIGITSFIILFFFLLLLYYYIEKNRKQKLILRQKEELELALKNNKTLLKELNHRVKNNLQMVSSVISLQATKIKDESSKKHFESAINRIKVLSKIHNSLYSKNQLEEIDLLNYVIILKDYLMNSIINPSVKVSCFINIIPNLFIDNDKKTTIGLIINELITNSLKYAFSKQENNLITISIIKKEQFYHFCYTDNGKGFNYEETDKSKSIGLNLILRLVNQLGEEAEVNSSNGVNISFKF